MGSLDIRKHASLDGLVGAYIKEHGPKSLGRPPEAALLFAEPLFAGVALVAYWILKFAPTLLERPSLHIAIVSGLPGRPELAAGPAGYQLLPELLGKPELAITISSVLRNVDEQEEVADAESFRTYCLPLHAYLENAPDGTVDLLMLHDTEVGFSDVQSWAEPLGQAIGAGTKVAAIAMNEDEQLFVEGLLGLHGFTVAGAPIRNQFAPRLGWAELMWDVGADNVSNEPPGETAVEELQLLLAFTRQYSKRHGSYPPLSRYGATEVGKESPADDGKKMICLPEGLYFDPATERFSKSTPNGLVSIRELDELGRKSALLVSYDGRTSRFQRLMWAVRVFFECAQVLPSLVQSLNDGGEADDDDEAEVCPGCGGVHTATERIDSMKEYLSGVLEGESPRTQVRAALELALDIVKKGGAIPDRTPETDDYEDNPFDDASDIELYESLLNRHYFQAAWGLAKDCEDVDLVMDGQDSDGWPLSMLLVEHGRWDLLVEQLMDKDGIAATSDEGGTIFHAMAWNDEPVPLELLQALREALADFEIDANTPDDSQTFPIEEAVALENWGAVAQLIDVGASLACTDLNDTMIAEALAEFGFKEQAEKIAPKTRKKRTRKTT